MDCTDPDGEGCVKGEGYVTPPTPVTKAYWSFDDDPWYFYTFEDVTGNGYDLTFLGFDGIQSPNVATVTNPDTVIGGDNPYSVIGEINPSNYENFKKDGVINSGMIPKIDNAFDALNAGVNAVRIMNSLHIQEFAEGDGSVGTLIVK